MKPSRNRAEEHFAAIKKKEDSFVKEKEKAAQKRAEHTANLRALRLAKEAKDKMVTEKKGA